MESVFNLLFGIANSFWKAFVAFKVYGWFYTEVGIDLPMLNYLNIFAIIVVLWVFTTISVERELRIGAIYKSLDDKYKDKMWVSTVTTIVLYATFLLIAYLYKIILF